MRSSSAVTHSCRDATLSSAELDSESERACKEDQNSTGSCQDICACGQEEPSDLGSQTLEQEFVI